VAGLDGGGGGPVRKIAWGPLCSFEMRWRRWWEGWFGQCGGGVVRPRTGDDSPELGLGATSSGASSGSFIGARGSMVAWARAVGEGETRGKTEGAVALLAPTGLAVAPAAPAPE
jgi:hypothetical protein